MADFLQELIDRQRRREQSNRISEGLRTMGGALMGQPYSPRASSGDNIEDFIVKEQIKSELEQKKPKTIQEQLAAYKLARMTGAMGQPQGQIPPGYIEVPSGRNEYGEVTTKFIEDPNLVSQRKGEEAAAGDAAKRTQKLSELNKALDFFETKIGEIAGGTGVPGKLKGLGIEFRGMTGLDPKAAAYKASVEGLRSQIVRGLGDVGNLSEYEQKYASSLLPGISDNLETRAAKIKNFRDYISFKTGNAPKNEAGGVPGIGSTFNGEKVTNVERVE